MNFFSHQIICKILTEALSDPVCPIWTESHKKFKDKICWTNNVLNLTKLYTGWVVLNWKKIIL